MTAAALLAQGFVPAAIAAEATHPTDEPEVVIGEEAMPDGAEDAAPQQDSAPEEHTPAQDEATSEGDAIGVAEAPEAGAANQLEALQPDAEAAAADQSVPAPAIARQEAPIEPLAAADATIRVQTAGDRLGLSRDLGASGLAGVTFMAYPKYTSQDQNVPTIPPGGAIQPVTCTSDANGVCLLGVDSDSRRWLVVETSSPSGWAKIDEIALGRFNVSGTNRAYRWNVAVSAGGTATVPRTEIENRSSQRWPDRPNPAGNLGRNDYRWANVRDNPLVPDNKCGLSIALLFDQSGSIGDNLSQVQSAATDFVDQLTGTPTSIATFTFSTNSPRDNAGSRNRPAPISIADPSGADRVKANINGLSPAGGGTNWDHGLRQIAAAAPDYDVAIVLTDGNPTAWRGETSSTSDVDDYDVEEAVHSANWLKSLGTRVIAIGFSGTQNGLTPTNLSLISGPTEGNPDDPRVIDDYFLTTFGKLADLLADIALNNCGGTINVQKRIAPTWSEAQSVAPEPNWPFEARESSRLQLVTPPNGTTGPNGEPLTFSVDFAQGVLAPDVAISEPDLQSNVLVQDPNGNNASCFINGQQRPDRIDNIANGFVVRDVADNEIISCLVVNSPAQLEAKKYHDLDGDGAQDPGEPFLEGWTIFLDDNNNAQLDPGEVSLSTDANGAVLFDRLDAPADYRVCEVLQDGWFNTEPGGGAVCRTQRVELQGADDPPAGPVIYGNVQGGSFTVTKTVVDDSGLIPLDLEYTIEVLCSPADQLGGVQYPRTFTLTAGESVTVGPLIEGTTCTIEETEAQGAQVEVSPATVTIPADDGVTVTVTNTYPAGLGEVVKVIDLKPGLPADLIKPGTAFPIDISCTFPDTDGFPNAGQPIPGFSPLSTTIAAGDPITSEGPVTSFGPLPVGSACTITETDDRGATEVVVEPQPYVITDDPDPANATVTNIYEPAALQIIKVVEGAVLPPDTVFQAGVVCRDGTDELVNLSVSQPGVVSNILKGTICVVREVDTQGGVAEIDPGGPFQVGDDLVEVTITNTFGTGDLTITKSVDDNNTGLVPPNTAFTVSVACEFDVAPVPGFPRDVILTTPDRLQQTLTDIPLGSECTVTESDSAGAGDIVITPEQPVTITPGDQGAVQVTVTNFFESGEFELTKIVDDPSGLVPGATQYTLSVTCNYPDDWPASGQIPGFDPKTLTLTAGQAVPSGQLPVGATCTIEETGTGGAGTVDVVPDTVVVGETPGPVTVTVTNTYPVGALELRKAVEDGGTGTIPLGTEFTLRVECVYPSDHPSQGPIPGFSPLDVTVPSGVGGAPGAAVTVGAGGLPAGNTGLPVGATCTVSEPDPQGATSVEVVPNQPVTVTEDSDDPVEVVVTNTYPVGSGEVVKVTDGVLAPEFAPEGSAFEVAVTCVYPDGFPVSGPIFGFNPLNVTIAAGPPGQPGTPAPFGAVPIGSQCTVVETSDGGATRVEISPDQPITITDDQTRATVTVTNTFDAAGVQITKVVSGEGGDLVPPDLVYTVDVLCVFNGPAGIEVVFDEEVDFGVGDTTVVPGPGTASGLPVGSVCLVTEVEANGATASVTPSGPFLVQGPAPVIVDVVVENTFDAGELTIAKAVDGEMADLVPDGTQYSVSVSCSIGGSTLIDFPRELVLTTPDQLSATITGLPVGAECFATEADTNGAVSPPVFDPPGNEEFQSGTVMIVGEPQEPISIIVTNTYRAAFGEIVKVVDGPASGVAPASYPVEVTCLLPPDFPGAPGPVPGFDPPLELTITAGPPGQPGTPVGFGPVPVGSECTVRETGDGGATSVTISPDQPVTLDDTQAPLEIVVTNTFDDGGLVISKVVDGPASGFVPAGTQYTVRVQCTFEASVLDQEFPLTQDSPVAITDLPLGSECTVTEVNAQGAGTVTITPDQPVTITDPATPVEVTVTNSYPAGTAVITKTVDGDLAELVSEGTIFEVAVTCVFPDDFPADGPIPGYSPDLVEVPSGPPGEEGAPTPIGLLPVGSACTVAEFDSNGASDTVISPEEFTIGADGAVGVAVTNTYDPAALRIIKAVDGPGAPLIPLDTVFTADVECVPPAGNPNPGFAGEVEFGLDDPAIISGQPEGSTCTVTETGTQGASEVEYAPSQTVILEGPDPVQVDITITNTFGFGELVVRKELAGDGAGFVPDGTVFSLSVVCAFDGNEIAGFDPWLVDLVTPDTLEASSNEVGPLPVGAECTVTETEDQGAAVVAITPDQPVALTPGGEGPVEVTVENTFTVGDLTLQKELDGQGGPLIPDGIEFVADVSCTFLGSPVAGFDPLEVRLTTPDQLTQTVGPLPTGAECTVTETEDQGAQSVVITPEQPVTIAGESSAVKVLITNTFPAGALTIEKRLRGAGALFVPDGTVFEVDVRCTFNGIPVEPFTPDTVALVTPDDLSRTVGPLPVGAECTVTESQSNGADDVAIRPEQPVVVTDDESPVEVLVINTYLGGGGLPQGPEIVKVVEGPLVPEFAPEGTAFTVQVRCEFGGDFPATGPIPGYDPLELTIAAGPAGRPGPPVPVGLLPIGSTCAVTETDSNGADPVTIEPQTFTIEGPGQVVEVTVTNTFEAGALRIVKILDGDGGSLVPPETEFIAAVECSFEGQVVFGAEIPFGPTDPGVVSNLPRGSTCQVTEVETNGAQKVTVDPAGPFPIAGDDPVEVTVTNTFDAGDVTLIKVVDGPGAGYLPDGTTFTVDLACTFAGSPVDGFDPRQVDLFTPDGLQQTAGPLPVGAECTATESEDNGAQRVLVEPEGGVTVGGDEPVAIRVTNTYEAGQLLIEKVINGPADLVDGPFEFDVTCVFLGAELDPQPGTATIDPPATSAIVDGLPLGAECTVVELPPYGGADGPAVIDPGTVIIGDGDPVQVTATNTFTRPHPPNIPETGAGGAVPLTLAGASLLATGAMLVWWSMRLRGRTRGDGERNALA